MNTHSFRPFASFSSLTWLWLLIASISTFAQTSHTTIYYNQTTPQVQFAASEIRAAIAAKSGQLVERGLSEFTSQSDATTLVIAGGASESQQLASKLGLKPLSNSNEQAYAIRVKKNLYVVLGTDAAGAMYGGFDLAEAIRLGTLAELKDADHTPHITQRGIKFNIPLDTRTPSYSDNNDSAQNNIPEMWSMDFWREMLDEMARHRYNVLTLWNLHPFPSIVSVPEYPDVALNNVMRATKGYDNTFSHSGRDMVRPELLKNLEVVKKMTISEKIQFWRDVMQYAHNRGIAVYWFTWNIFTFGAEGKYGITPAQNNPQTIAYFRASVRETVLTYPLLAGIGITAGEQMESRQDEFSKEKWLWKTYGEGIRDALKLQPERKFRLIHRYHQTAQQEILTEFKDYPGPFDLSFKYAIAHMYSSPKPPFIQAALPFLSPKLRSWLTVRNDDIYSFRWGNPSYAREFIRNIPGSDKVAGFYMGPDGYVWGREFLSTEPDTPREPVIKKQWYSFMLWGRLSYEPDLPDALFQRTIAQRFPNVAGDKLMATWSASSNVMPLITRFFWGDIDLRWFPEAGLSHPNYRGWYTVRHFIEGQTMPESGILNIIEYRERLAAKQALNQITPLQVADELAGYAQATLRELPALRAQQGQSKELRLTLGDLEAMAHLGNYYAEKIRGATALALYDLNGKAEDQATAIRHLESALAHWKSYAAVYGAQYKPQLLNRVGYVDIPALTTKVASDIEMARNWNPGTIKPSEIRRNNADNPFKP
ncbi:MAG TPA: alpha-glucuronidase family glycosyl hydrolase [Blastocatellia bacterium]|nr:alpha-glucuronidase family glycosyl hydrolase [Blastocatellia bacterium]